MNIPKDLYTVSEVARLLGLHVKTVRHYVREGRLKSTRIGKQYRVAKADLEAFTGAELEATPATRRQRDVEVSTVVQIDAIDADAASRVTNTLLAASKGRGEEAALRVETIYDEERARLKVIILGSITSSCALLEMINTLAADKS